MARAVQKHNPHQLDGGMHVAELAADLAIQQPGDGVGICNPHKPITNAGYSVNTRRNCQSRAGIALLSTR